MPLSLSSRYCGNVFVVHCKGRIVAGDEVRSLEGALDAASREFSRMVLNVAEVDRLDSSGIGLLVRHASKLRAKGGGIRLAAAPRFIADLLELTRLTSVLPVFANEEDAIVSFLGAPAASVGALASGQGGQRVLLVDASMDLCAFVRSLLAHHGFEVKSANRASDAKIMLRVDPVDYILLGPDSSQFSAETAGSLQSLVPAARTLQLPPDFKSRDAAMASTTLLQMFGAAS
jgi:anti-sigma B factor antagonist